MKVKQFLKIINKVFPGSVVIKESEQENQIVTPSQAGRILAKSKGVKKTRQVDKNQLNLFN